MDKDIKRFKIYRGLFIFALIVEGFGLLLALISGSIFFLAEVALTLYTDYILYKLLKKREAEVYNNAYQQSVENAQIAPDVLHISKPQYYRCPICNASVSYGEQICKNCGTVFNWDAPQSSDES